MLRCQVKNTASFNLDPQMLLVPSSMIEPRVSESARSAGPVACFAGGLSPNHVPNPQHSSFQVQFGVRPQRARDGGVGGEIQGGVGRGVQARSVSPNEGNLELRVRRNSASRMLPLHCAGAVQRVCPRGGLTFPSIPCGLLDSIFPFFFFSLCPSSPFCPLSQFPSLHILGPSSGRSSKAPRCKRCRGVDAASLSRRGSARVELRFRD